MQKIEKLNIIKSFVYELYNTSSDPQEQQLYTDFTDALYIRYINKAPLLPLMPCPNTKPFINCFGQVVPPPPAIKAPAVPVKPVQEAEETSKSIATNKDLMNIFNDLILDYDNCFEQVVPAEPVKAEPEAEETAEERDKRLRPVIIADIKDQMNICNDLISDYEDAQEQDEDIEELDIKGHFKDPDIDVIINGLFDIESFVCSLNDGAYMEVSYNLTQIKEYLEEKLDEI